MKSQYIPATQESAQQSYEYVVNKIIELEAATSTRKRESLRNKLLLERLQGLLLMHHQFEYEIDNLNNLLDPKFFDKEVRKNSQALTSLKKSQVVKRLVIAELNLEIERGYASIANRTLEFLWQVSDGDEYRKIKSSNARQTKREKNFENDNKKLMEILIDLRKSNLMRPLDWGDFPEFIKKLYSKYPKPEYVTEPRISGQNKRLTGEDLKEAKDDLKKTRSKDPWGKPRLMEFFKEKNHLQSPKVKNAS